LGARRLLRNSEGDPTQAVGRPWVVIERAFGLEECSSNNSNVYETRELLRKRARKRGARRGFLLQSEKQRGFKSRAKD